ncbi:sugar transferase [Candidatus Viridilinea mediisalina]|nr:sugar transferase [Candidatus Viridilinea mediisalina]
MSSQVMNATTTIQLDTRDQDRRREMRATLLIIALGDALVLTIGFAIAYFMRFQFEWQFFNEGSARTAFYAVLIAILVPAWLLLFWVYGLYDQRNLFGGTQEYERIFNACSLGMLMVIMITFVQPDFIIARGWLIIGWLATLCLAILWRFGARRVVYRLRCQGKLQQRVLIIGANAESRIISEQLSNSPISGIQIVGFVDDHLPPDTQLIPGTKVLGPISDFERIVAETGVDTVIITDTALVRERMATIYGAMETLQRLNVSLAPGLFEILTIGVHVHELGAVPLLSLSKTRINGVRAFIKAMIDRVGAFFGLLLLSPLLIIVAIMIRLDSPGPIIHRRRVMGVGNKTFDAYKFRSMRIEGNSLLTPEQHQELKQHGKLKDDPRITKLGRFIRRTSIDELPQLVNILLGQMSIVGPRMITVEELEVFGRWRHNLFTVRPGLTGLWQISGRSDLGYEDRVRLDMHYIRNYSLWLDMHIISRTIQVVISGRGAY